MVMALSGFLSISSSCFGLVCVCFGRKKRRNVILDLDLRIYVCLINGVFYN